MKTRFAICDKVVFFNAPIMKVATAEVKGVRIVPTGISKDAKGENKLDGYEVLYETMEGYVLSEKEVFASEQELVEAYKKVFS